MRTIWKFPLPLGDAITVQMPKGAIFRSVQLQGRDICLWAEVDDEAEIEYRDFLIFGTGRLMPRTMGHSDVYLATVQMGQFVWHVYEHTGV